jgi:hypothetical protein
MVFSNVLLAAFGYIRFNSPQKYITISAKVELHFHLILLRDAE